MNDSHNHICWECSRAMDSTCEWHSHKKEIDGMKKRKRSVSRTEDGYNYILYKITVCPEFVDDTECKSCVYESSCLTLGTIGVECKRFKRRQRER